MIKIIRNFSIKPYLTMRLDVTADYFFEAGSRDDIIECLKYARNSDLPVIMLGGGSNTVFSKHKVKALVIKNNYLEKKIIKTEADKVLISVSSGYPISRLAYETVKDGLSGLEYFAGLPGTVGGAVYTNAKWTKPFVSVGNFVSEICLIGKDLKTKKLGSDYFKFSYGYSYLQKTKDIVLEVIFQLKKQSSAPLLKKMNDIIKYRVTTQPAGVKSCGCFFKNISDKDKKNLGLPTASAGYIIDQCGLKNTSVGGFTISKTHANYIINNGSGEIKDLLKLVKIVKSKVKDRFGILLKEEVEVK